MSPRVSRQRVKRFIFILLSALFTITNCKPTLPFSLPQSLQFSFPSFTTFQQYIEKRQTEAMKSYSGRRLAADSLRMVYYNDQTIAIVELGPEKLLISCELIEIYNDEEGKILLGKLSRINRPLQIDFGDMLKLMQQCNQVEKLRTAPKRRASEVAALYERDSDPKNDEQDENVQGDAPFADKSPENENRGILSGSPFSLLSGVFPGTKWCGTGDIAKNFHDLGEEKDMDRCCRDHDICPIKVRAYQSRYNLTNNSIYTKSHCVCDDLLFECLKKTNTPTAQLMGTIYFNLVQVPCVVEGPNGKMKFRKAKDGF
ncbi:uncharacterized protein [Chironomus tepperi]|uniref:uncharacterized protein n=1 Tax=Chironomus tepperi TaxID=113505 RepID=UPI00391F2306